MQGRNMNNDNLEELLLNTNTRIDEQNHTKATNIEQARKLQLHVPEHITY